MEWVYSISPVEKMIMHHYKGNKCPDAYHLVLLTTHPYLTNTFHVSSNSTFTITYVVTAFIFWAFLRLCKYILSLSFLSFSHSFSFPMLSLHFNSEDHGGGTCHFTMSGEKPHSKFQKLVLSQRKDPTYDPFSYLLPAHTVINSQGNPISLSSKMSIRNSLGAPFSANTTNGYQSTA